MKMYKLMDEHNHIYDSEVPGMLGGNKRLKIYGRLDCKSALRWIKKGKYVKTRVFFINEGTAIKAGFRPCAICMPDEYQEWKKKKLVKN